MSDLISRQAAIEPFMDNADDWVSYDVRKSIERLPSVEQGIPLDWIEKHLEWLGNCDNDFAQLAKVSIRAMVELWKKDRI